MPQSTDPWLPAGAQFDDDSSMGDTFDFNDYLTDVPDAGDNYLDLNANFPGLKSPNPYQNTLYTTKALSDGADLQDSSPSAPSPTESYQESSSGSSTRYKRKTSADSSRSALTGTDLATVGMNETLWRSQEGEIDTRMDDAEPLLVSPSQLGNYDASESFDQFLNYDNLADSPAQPPVAALNSTSRRAPVLKTEPDAKKVPFTVPKPRTHSKKQQTNPQAKRALISEDLGETSPCAIYSHESSPIPSHNNVSSPGTVYNQNISHSAVPQMPLPFDYVPNGGQWITRIGDMNNGYASQTLQAISQPNGLQNAGPAKPILHIHPIPLKTRVETQIPIKMTLYPMPPGVTKLLLPLQSISKPKLFAKPPPQRDATTLILEAALVCRSAMKFDHLKRRALEKAALGTTTSPNGNPSDSSDEEKEEDEDKPLKGGEVRICKGCIDRENKRAARKKIKKAEEEAEWSKYEEKRIIVFNTNEVKEWQLPTVATSIPDHARGRSFEFPDGAMQIDAPMRIACYCRHHNEKSGFQVIFTIKDHQGRVIAQQLSDPIMVTDDHKTHPAPDFAGSIEAGPGTSLSPEFGGLPMDPTFHNPYTQPSFPAGTDLSGLQGVHVSQQFPLSFPGSQASSAAPTPRTFSRQTTPSGTTGPATKKRKSSGKIPPGLTMTNIGENNLPSENLDAGPATTTSPYAQSNMNPFSAIPQSHFGQISAIAPHQPPQYNAGSSSPGNDGSLFTNAHRSQSMDNIGLRHIGSTSSSTRPSRATSPAMQSNASAYQLPQTPNPASFTQTVSPVASNTQGPVNPPRPPPIINKVIPCEGPVNGNVEVTILGSGFSQGMEVMFGNHLATTTTFWSENSLVCLVPPAASPGLVPISFRSRQQQQQGNHLPPVLFRYVGTDENEIMRHALQVLSEKMNSGNIHDVRDIAHRIINNQLPWASSTGGQGGSGFNTAAGFDVELALIKCLELIDLDDSRKMPRLNMRRPSGQTLLHLACSLGFHRFAAGLLARGANPEPRDKGGFTPMHYAALHNHSQIVRRLMLSGADPMIRSLRGYTPADMTDSADVKRVVRRVEYHQRRHSASSLRSRASSATSLTSLWEPYSTTASPVNAQNSNDDSDLSSEDHTPEEDEDEDADADDEGFYMRSKRRSSAQVSRRQSMAPDEDADPHPILDLPPNVAVAGGLASPAAAMIAFRDHLTAQIQQLQQTMQMSLPTLPNLPPMPHFSGMPTLPDYQAYLPTAPMVRRISNLVGNNRADHPREQDYKWSDFFSRTTPAAPPAYDEIYPQDDDTQLIQTYAPEDKSAQDLELVETSQPESSTEAQGRNLHLGTVRIGQKHVITMEQQDQLRLAHAEKVKRLSRDKKLFFVWIPLLVIIILAMLYNRVPQVWNRVSQMMTSARTGNDQANVVELH